MDDQVADDTFGHRQARLERRLQLLRIVGLALTAFVLALLSGDVANSVFAEAPMLFRPLTLTVTVAAGYALFRAYMTPHWLLEDTKAAVRTNPALVSKKIKDHLDSGIKPSVPAGLRGWMVATAVLTTIALGSFLLTAWWPMLSGGDCPAHVVTRR